MAAITFSPVALPYRDGEISESVADWWDRYVEQFNVAPEYSAMEGYRNADVVVRALQAAGPELARWWSPSSPCR